MAPPSSDFHILTPPIKITSGFVGETSIAKSYRLCPPEPVPSLELFKILGELDCNVNDSPSFEERYKPKKPESVLLPARKYT